MKTHLFKVECLTDMHVGNGEATYSIIDNEVQKDTVLQDVPIIHASGVKGALKEHLKQFYKITDNDDLIKSIFGHQDGAGEYKFFSALCLARPLRVTDGAGSYILASSNDILDHFKFLLKGLGRPEAFELAFEPLKNDVSIEVEGHMVKTKRTNSEISLFGSNFVVLDNLKDYDLPVRARNVLDDNGLSKNLWYEELVPHKSIFFLAVLVPDRDINYPAFKNAIQQSAVQFGGNASVGNGYTTITEVYPNE